MPRLLFALFALLFAAAGARAAVTLTHVHGLSYSGDGKKLMIPSHHGLAVHENGKWSRAPGPKHDYMGFAATAKHLYSSGHPAPGSGLVNPFGLIRSKDGGKTWDRARGKNCGKRSAGRCGYEATARLASKMRGSIGDAASEGDKGNTVARVDALKDMLERSDAQPATVQDGMKSVHGLFDRAAEELRADSIRAGQFLGEI